MKKTPEIKEWDCVNHDPIEEWIPDDPLDVEFWCRLRIGIKEENDADNFDVHVATHKAVSRLKDKNYLFVIPYYESWNSVHRCLESVVQQCVGENWLAVCEQLSERFRWEFEGMR
ncbi:Imm8 family immunity protein [Sessilibacter corallicola]|uniref:Immunity protein 8 of polymorphic toxin system n=1 Tax=Sessilibacter corallicola TaxID=2904075 RepID=A0ABQ0A9Q0_9GAMM